MSRAQNTAPFFIVGSQRSGTTMLRLMLNNHPHLVVPHESVFITEYFQRLPEYGDLCHRDNARRLLNDISDHPQVKRGQLIADPDAVLEHRIETYSDLVDAIFRTYTATIGKTRWGDKSPSYTEHLDIVRHVFPRAKIIHLVRDGRDVVLSAKSIEWMSGNLPKLILDWQWKTTIAHKVGAVLGADFLEIHYEDLVCKSEDTLRRVCEFIGEAYDQAMLDYWQTAKGVMPTESLKWHRHSILAPDPSLVNKWKTRLSRSERTIFEQLAGETLDLFGYEREHLSPTNASRALKVYYTLVKRN